MEELIKITFTFANASPVHTMQLNKAIMVGFIKGYYDTFGGIENNELELDITGLRIDKGCEYQLTEIFCNVIDFMATDKGDEFIKNTCTISKYNNDDMNTIIGNNMRIIVQLVSLFKFLGVLPAFHYTANILGVYIKNKQDALAGTVEPSTT